MSASKDRGWMYKRRNSEGHLCSYYKSKVSEFLNFAFSIKKVVEVRTLGSKVVFRIKCPCSRCKIKVFKERHEVEYDLWSNGFIRGYTTWYAHGERKSKPKEIRQCSKSMEVDDVGGCTRMILDMLEAENEQAPNLHSEPLEEEAPNSYAKEYYDMLEADDEPLYEGCQKYSTLEAATRLLNWKAECNVPEATYNRALSIFKDMLPGDKLVGNFYETKKILKKLNLPREKIHACKNHCMLFYGKVDSLLSKCKVCGHSRYKNGGRNNVPNLVLTYFPIAPRLQRMYMSKKMSKEMTWHHDHKTDSNKMVHPSDGKAWKHFDSTHYSSFSKEIQNVRLGLCTDGFNPNNSNSNSCSLWPVFLTIYNLPPWMCLKDENVKLSLVIPGKKNPGQNIDVFLQPLIKELKILWNSGVETYDAYRKNNFHLKAALLWTISDFPAYAMLSGWSTHGKLACPHCMGDVHSFQLQNGGKPCWFDCHRRFLPLKHPYRRDRKGFRAKKSALAGPPPQLTGNEIWEQIRYLLTVYEGKPYKPGNKKIDGFSLTHNWVKRSIFWELPYCHTLLIRHNLDLMHIEKNFFENLFHTIMGTLKTKDNVKARKDIEIYCDRPELHIFKVQNKDMKPKASYTLSKPQLQNVCEWMTKIKFTDGYASNIGGCVNLADYSFYSFKSHDRHVFMQRLLSIALRGMLPNALWDVITELCTFFHAICSRVLRIEYLEKLQRSIVETICKLEKIFPPGFFDSMEHLVVHLVSEALLGGPKILLQIFIALLEQILDVGSNVAEFGNQDGDHVDGSRSLGRGQGRSEHIGIGVGSNVAGLAGLGNQNRDYDDDSRSLGRGRGRSEHIGIDVGSNVAEFGNQDGDHVDGSRSLGRGYDRSSNVSRGISGHIGNQDVDYDCDNGSISRGRGRGRSGNTCGRGSSSTSGCGNPDADYDNGTHGDNNDNATETSQHVRGLNLLQSIPNHPSQRPMITLYYGGFAEPHDTRDIISILKISFYGSWATWREDQYQWHPSENAAVYRAWEKVMSSRFSDILGACRREAALRATEDNIKVGNDLSVLKLYTPSWIDQADWEDMIDRVWNTSRWKKKSAIARQNRLRKTKKRLVSLLEAYEYTHTQETTEALGNVTDEGSGDGTDEAVGSGTREYITRRSKRVADAVEAAIEDEHSPDASQHPPNDFDLWEKATRGKKKGKLVGLGTRGDTRLMVTSRKSSSYSSSHAHHTGSQPSEQVQTLEEVIRQLQEDNARMRARSEVKMQVEVQRQMESQLQEHMRQRELEANAREEAREREWQRKMDDINLMLKKYNDPLVILVLAIIIINLHVPVQSEISEPKVFHPRVVSIGLCTGRWIEGNGRAKKDLSAQSIGSCRFPARANIRRMFTKGECFDRPNQGMLCWNEAIREFNWRGMMLMEAVSYRIFQQPLIGLIYPVLEVGIPFSSAFRYRSVGAFTSTPNHILDLYHKYFKPQRTVVSGFSPTIIHDTRELDKSRCSWFSVSRNPFVIKLPEMCFSHFYALLVRNLIAYEQTNDVGKYISSYALAMDILIDGQEDIDKLEEKKIIINLMGSNQEAADMINSIVKEVPVTDFFYGHELERLVRYHEGYWPKNIVWLRRRYFNSPWSIIALFAGIIVFALTVVQTYFTIKH
ncbi:uncharacterized protein Tco_0336966 [Tanacetum coccineum]